MHRIARLAWAALILNVVVILGGALVRATGSGAGCGRSWPTCDGQVIPAEIEGALAIEFAHRLLSGLALITVFALYFTIRRSTVGNVSRGEQQLRTAGWWAVVTIVGEALIGAGIVLFEWVSDDSSVARTVAVPLHLLNTLLLLGALAITVSLSTSDKTIEWSRLRRDPRVAAGLGLMVLVAASGAVTALADTLYPKNSLSFDGFGAESLLTSLRVVHPALAIAAALIIMRIALVRPAGLSGYGLALARAIIWLVAVQLAAGITNVALLVPVWMQLLHLGLADALWIAFVWYAAELHSRQSAPAQLS